MDMEIYHETNRSLEKWFRVLEKKIPSPVLIPYGKNSVIRYPKEHQRLDVAIVQKLARYISGLNASLLLIELGFIQETGVIFRTLGEFFEDTIFLALPIIGGIEVTEAHKKYRKNFFQEEFDDPNNPFRSPQKREAVSRQDISNVLAKFDEPSLNRHDCREGLRTISKVYSGYVHGPSCHICEMIDGNSLRYFLAGMPGTSRQDEFISGYWDYAYRGLVILIWATKVLDDATVREEVVKFIEYFEKTTGKTGSGDPEKLAKEIKRKNA